MQAIMTVDGGSGRSSSFEDSLAYLLVFSEALLDLVPDGIGVLDEDLRVRAANPAFLEAFGFESLDDARRASLADDSLFRVPVPEYRDAPLREAVRELFVAPDEEIGLEGVEVRNPRSGDIRRWSVRVAPWDTEDPRFRRLLVWLHPWKDRDEAGPDARGEAPAPVAPAEPAEPTEPEEPTAAGRPETPATTRAAPLGEEGSDELFRLASLTQRLLETLPVGVCVTDPAGRVRRAGKRLQDLFGRAFRPEGPGDRHLLAVFPELRDDGFAAFLATDPAGSGRRYAHPAVPPGDPSVRFEVEVQFTGPEDDVGTETLFVFHEVHRMQPPYSATDVKGPPPVGVLRILDPQNTARWPVPSAEKILVVEADSWTRMVLSDALREGGFEDLVFAEANEAAFSDQDPASFALVLVGLDGDADAARDLCQRLAAEAADVPVLCVSDRRAEDASGVVAGIGVAGLLAGLKAKELREVVAGLVRRGQQESDPAVSLGDAGEAAAEVPSGADAPPDRYDVVVLGAGDADVAVLRMLYRVPHMKVRLVFDPDPGAFGLSLAQNLGIPAISGGVALELQSPPHAVVLARGGLEEHLEGLGFGDVVRVTRDEVELFLVDPASFLETEQPSPDPAQGADAGSSPGDASGDEETLAPGNEGSAADPEDDEAPALAGMLDLLDQGSPAAEDVAPGEAPERQPQGVVPSQELPAHFEEPEPEPEQREPEPPPTRSERLNSGVMRDPFSPEFALSAGVPPQGDDEAVPANEEVGSLLAALDLLLDFDRFSNHVLDMALEMVDGASGSLMLLQEDRRSLRIIASRGLSDIVVQKTRQRVGEGISGRVAADGEPLLLVGTIGDERFQRSRERKEIRSSVCVPVIGEGQVVGVLNVNSHPMSAPFDERSLRDVAVLGRQIGSPLDRSRQLRRMRGRSFELSVRAEIEAIASSQDDMVSRMRRVTARLVQMLDIDTCAVWLLNPTADGLVLRSLSGGMTASMDAVTVPVGTGLVGWIAKNLRPLVLRNSVDDPNDPTRLTSAGVPIRWHTELVGVLAVESTSRTPMDEDRLSLLASVASVIGEQLGVSRAYEDSERKVTMLSALSELGVAFSAAQERTSLSKLVTFSASTVLESDVSTIRLRRFGIEETADPEAHELLAAHGASVGGPGDPLAGLEDRIVREVLTTRNPCRDADLPLPEIEPLMMRSNVAAFLGIPMMSGRDLIGVIAVYRVQDPLGRNTGYREEDLEIALRLGDYAAAAAHRFVAIEEEEEEI